MPTKKCPYCAEEIQEEAIKCKQCKNNLVPQSSSPVKPQPTHSDTDKKTITHNKGKYYRIAFYVCLVIGVLGLINIATEDVLGVGIVSFWLIQVLSAPNLYTFFSFILYLPFLWLALACYFKIKMTIIDKPTVENQKKLRRLYKILYLTTLIFGVLGLIDMATSLMATSVFFQNYGGTHTGIVSLWLIQVMPGPNLYYVFSFIPSFAILWLALAYYFKIKMTIIDKPTVENQKKLKVLKIVLGVIAGFSILAMLWGFFTVVY